MKNSMHEHVISCHAVFILCGLSPIVLESDTDDFFSSKQKKKKKKKVFRLIFHYVF